MERIDASARASRRGWPPDQPVDDAGDRRGRSGDDGSCADGRRWRRVVRTGRAWRLCTPWPERKPAYKALDTVAGWPGLGTPKDGQAQRTIEALETRWRLYPPRSTRHWWPLC